LTIQVKSACGGSNETVGYFQHHFRAGALSASGYGAALNSVSFSQGDYPFVFQVHVTMLHNRGQICKNKREREVRSSQPYLKTVILRRKSTKNFLAQKNLLAQG